MRDNDMDNEQLTVVPIARTTTKTLLEGANVQRFPRYLLLEPFIAASSKKEVSLSLFG